MATREPTMITRPPGRRIIGSSAEVSRTAVTTFFRYDSIHAAASEGRSVPAGPEPPALLTTASTAGWRWRITSAASATSAGSLTSARTQLTCPAPAGRRTKDVLPPADDYHVHPVGGQRGGGGSSDARPATRHDSNGRYRSGRHGS